MAPMAATFASFIVPYKRPPQADQERQRSFDDNRAACRTTTFDGQNRRDGWRIICCGGYAAKLEWCFSISICFY